MLEKFKFLGCLVSLKSILIGPDTRKLMFDEDFLPKVTEVERAA
jgi:hypothetical protein